MSFFGLMRFPQQPMTMKALPCEQALADIRRIAIPRAMPTREVQSTGCRQKLNTREKPALQPADNFNVLGERNLATSMKKNCCIGTSKGAIQLYNA